MIKNKTHVHVKHPLHINNKSQQLHRVREIVPTHIVGGGNATPIVETSIQTLLIELVSTDQCGWFFI